MLDTVIEQGHEKALGFTGAGTRGDQGRFVEGGFEALKGLFLVTVGRERHGYVGEVAGPGCARAKGQ